MLTILPADFRVVGFDLDDTLHFFKRASSIAVDMTLMHIADQSSLDKRVLHDSYQAILQGMQQTHFVENKPSREYRKARFEQLLVRNNIYSADYIEHVLDIYDDTLTQNLLMKEGALVLLQTLDKWNKSVIIISEGPQDAQELTLERLGLFPYVERVYTSSKYETSKTDGLFDLVLRDMNCTAEEVLYIGDNPTRDYDPAAEIGICTVLLDELDNSPNYARRVKSLVELRDCFLNATLLHK